MERPNRTTRRRPLVPFGWAMMVAFAAAASLSVVQRPARAQPASRPAAKLIRFIPKADDAPAQVSVGGARCGLANQFDPQLKYAVLLPQRRTGVGQYTKQWGVTTQESPSLFWYTTKPTDLTASILLTRDVPNPTPDDTIVNIQIVDPLACGLQRLDLKKLGVKLEPGAWYRWSVQYVSHENRPPAEKASGLIRRLPLNDPRVAAIQAAPAGPARAAECAKQGVWIDLLEALSDAVEQNPADSDARANRANLLENTGELRVSSWIAGGQ